MTRDEMRRSAFEDKYPPPEGVEWVEELGYYSTKAVGLLPQMDTYNEWFDVWVSALHSVEAEKEPVNLPPAKPDLDPVEAHKRGEFVSDVEAAYNDGWNDCRHAAMYQTEKEPEWISCKDRLPTEDDGDCCQKIWAFRREDGHACHDFVTWVARMPHLFSHWAPTGLRRPAPPEHKPE